MESVWQTCSVNTWRASILWRCLGRYSHRLRDPAGIEGACDRLKVNPLLVSVALNVI